MREHLFKAKRADNGEWITGFYAYIESDNRYVILTQDEDGGLLYTTVDPSAVCEYTGLTKNGIKAFEFDKLRYSDGLHVVYGVIRCGQIPDTEGRSQHVGFYVEWENDGANEWGKWWRNDLKHWLENEPVEIIGNVFDSPELMGGKAE
jgi:hypothetical protein